jgi:hypothetical protein
MLASTWYDHTTLERCGEKPLTQKTEQQNFQSAMQLYSTLNLTPIERLEKEWNSLPKKVSQMYERLKVRIRPFLCACVRLRCWIQSHTARWGSAGVL